MNMIPSRAVGGIAPGHLVDALKVISPTHSTLDAIFHSRVRRRPMYLTTTGTEPQGAGPDGRVVTTIWRVRGDDIRGTEAGGEEAAALRPITWIVWRPGRQDEFSVASDDSFPRILGEGERPPGRCLREVLLHVKLPFYRDQQRTFPLNEGFLLQWKLGAYGSTSTEHASAGAVVGRGELDSRIVWRCAITTGSPTPPPSPSTPIRRASSLFSLTSPPATPHRPTRLANKGESTIITVFYVPGPGTRGELLLYGEHAAQSLGLPQPSTPGETDPPRPGNRNHSLFRDGPPSPTSRPVVGTPFLDALIVSAVVLGAGKKDWHRVRSVATAAQLGASVLAFNRREEGLPLYNTMPAARGQTRRRRNPPPYSYLVDDGS